MEQLHVAGVAVVVVAEGVAADPAADRLLAGWGVPVVAGRPRDALVEAGVASAAAVVCLPEDDLLAMETALLARRLRPDVRLVVRIGNAAVGRALAEVTGPGSVLDVAALAAPSMVEACLGSPPHPIELAGHRFVGTELTARCHGTLRELYGPLAPLAVLDRESGAEMVICPGRDHRVRAGDRVVVVGTPEQLADHSQATPSPTETPRAAGAREAGRVTAVDREIHGGHVGPFGLPRSILAEVNGPLRVTLGVLVTLAVLSMTVLRIGYVKPDGGSMSILDAAYFTVETISTIGYGDFSFADQPTWLRVYAVLFMLLGVVLAALWFALITELVVSGRVARSYRHRRVGSLRRHVIVIGLGAVGVRVVEGLVAAGRRVVVVERDEGNRHLERVRLLRVPVVHGDATDASVLTRVNLPAAAAVAVLTSDDLVNIETGLAVRGQLGRDWECAPVVLRVFDRELAEVIGHGFDFRWVRSTAALAAPWFVGAALGLDVLGTFYVGRIPFMIGRIAVVAGSGLDGLAMGELSARTRVVAIHRAPTVSGARDLEHPPRSGTRFSVGDDAYLVGPYEELLAVLRRDALAPDSVNGAEPSGGEPSRGDPSCHETSRGEPSRGGT